MVEERGRAALSRTQAGTLPGCRSVAADTQLIAIRITEICAVVVRVIVRPQPGLAFVLCATSHGSRIASINGIPAGREQCNHPTIPW